MGREDLFDMSFIRFPSAERRLIRTIGIQKEMTVMAGYSEEQDATVAEVRSLIQDPNQFHLEEYITVNLTSLISEVFFYSKAFIHSQISFYLFPNILYH